MVDYCTGNFVCALDKHVREFDFALLSKIHPQHICAVQGANDIVIHAFNSDSDSVG